MTSTSKLVEALTDTVHALEHVTTSETFHRDPRGDRAGPAIDAARAALSAAQEPDPWRIAVDTALVDSGLDCTTAQSDPTECVQRLVKWTREVALDPAVSAEAAALVERARAAAQEEAAPAYNGEEWEMLAMALASEDHEDIHHLLWEGGPIKEPWGEVWQKYEGDAKRMIALVRQHVPAAPSQAMQGDELSDEQIFAIADSEECNPDDRGWGPKFSVIAFARAILRTCIAPQQPLTDAEIRRLWHTIHPNDPMGIDRKFARVIEAAHGIGVLAFQPPPQCRGTLCKTKGACQYACGVKTPGEKHD